MGNKTTKPPLNIDVGLDEPIVKQGFLLIKPEPHDLSSSSKGSQRLDTTRSGHSEFIAMTLPQTSSSKLSNSSMLFGDRSSSFSDNRRHTPRVFVVGNIAGTSFHNTNLHAINEIEEFSRSKRDEKTKSLETEVSQTAVDGTEELTTNVAHIDVPECPIIGVSASSLVSAANEHYSTSSHGRFNNSRHSFLRRNSNTQTRRSLDFENPAVFIVCHDINDTSIHEAEKRTAKAWCLFASSQHSKCSSVDSSRVIIDNVIDAIQSSRSSHSSLADYFIGRTPR